MKQFKLLISLMVLFFATNMFAQTWTAQTSNVTRDLASGWAVDTNIAWFCGGVNTGSNAVCIRTTNGGTTWTSVIGNIPQTIGLFTISAINATEAWTGASDGSVYHTTNAGVNWTFVQMPTPVTAFVDVIHFFTPQIGFIIGDPATTTWCYYWTTNAGTNWTAAGPTFTGSEAGWNNGYGVIDTAHIWFGTNNTKIYKGSFRGGYTAYPSVGLYSFGMAFTNASTGVAIMANASGFLANNTTVNGGTSWAAGFTPAGQQYGLKSIPGYPYMWSAGASGTTGIIYYSTNNGTNWTSQFTTTAPLFSLTLANVNCGWAGGTAGAIFKYHGIINDINNNNSTVPVNYALEQNYPNPFNPTTTINYSIPKASFVTLKVYSVLGNEVMSIVNEQQSAKNYTYNVDFSKLSSGVYYYTLRAGDFSSTKKLMLIK